MFIYTYGVYNMFYILNVFIVKLCFFFLKKIVKILFSKPCDRKGKNRLLFADIYSSDLPSAGHIKQCFQPVVPTTHVQCFSKILFKMIIHF